MSFLSIFYITLYLTSIFNFFTSSDERRVTCAEIQKLSENAPPSMKGPCPLPPGIHTKELKVDIPQNLDLGVVGRKLGSVRIY